MHNVFPNINDKPVCEMMQSGKKLHFVSFKSRPYSENSKETNRKSQKMYNWWKNSFISTKYQFIQTIQVITVVDVTVCSIITFIT